MNKHVKKIATITLNPAIDQTLSVPNFALGRVNRVQSVRYDAGGKGVNVAGFLADYGLQTIATGFIGRENSRLFENFFKEKKISDRFIRINGSTRTGIKIIDNVLEHTTDINFPGLNPTSADLESLHQTIDELTGKCVWFIIAGSVPAGLTADIYHQMVSSIKKKGGYVALDTSGEGLRLAAAGMPDLVKPNIDELQEYSGRTLCSPAEIIDTAQELLANGVQTVVVSMGEKGALFVEENEIVQTTVPVVPIKSTVGAGDAMLSGMVAGKIENRTLTGCARLATAFSVIAISRIGAGLPSVSVLKSMERQIQVHSMK